MNAESEVDDKLASSMIQQAKKNLDRMNAELKHLVEDAAKLLGINGFWSVNGISYYEGDDTSKPIRYFNPLDPERGDLMKVAMAARLDIEFQSGQVWAFIKIGQPDYFDFVWDDHQSLALAVLRAASDVYKSRGGV